MEKLTIGIADNVFLNGFVDCHRYVINELVKAGHTVQIYSYDIEDIPRMRDLSSYIKGLKVSGLNELIHKRDQVVAHVYYDGRNLGGDLGVEHLFAMFLVSGFIPETQANVVLAQDPKFWSTGKRDSGIIQLNTPYKLN